MFSYFVEQNVISVTKISKTSKICKIIISAVIHMYDYYFFDYELWLKFTSNKYIIRSVSLSVCQSGDKTGNMYVFFLKRKLRTALVVGEMMMTRLL